MTMALFHEYESLLSPGDLANLKALRTAAAAAVVANRTYLAIPTPTTAQTVAQVAALTRQANGILRFIAGDFSGTG